MEQRVCLPVAGLIACLLWIHPSILAHSQNGSGSFPSRPIRMIVPFPAGGPSDIVARIIGQRMSENWGQPVVIENRPGANTIIGAQAAAKAPADGYTLFMAIDSTLVMNQFLYKNLPYDPVSDFAPISLTAKTVSVLAVSTASGLNSVKELIARARAQPGKLNYGAGTITAQLMGHLFHRAAGMDIVYVPYKGTPETVNGLLTGSVDLIYAANQIVTPLIASGCGRAAQPRGHFGLARACGPERHAQAHHRQSARRSGESSRRSGSEGKIRADWQLSRDQHARGIRCLHAQGGGALVARDKGDQPQARLILAHMRLPSCGFSHLRSIYCSFPAWLSSSSDLPGMKSYCRSSLRWLE